MEQLEKKNSPAHSASKSWSALGRFTGGGTTLPVAVLAVDLPLWTPLCFGGMRVCLNSGCGLNMHLLKNNTMQRAHVKDYKLVIRTTICK